MMCFSVTCDVPKGHWSSVALQSLSEWPQANWYSSQLLLASLPLVSCEL